jgi:hypothetical protein
MRVSRKLIRGDCHTTQKLIADSEARFKVLACGRRYGKTTLAVDLLVERLLKGERCAYFAPTFRMGAETWKALKTVLHPLIRSYWENSWRMELLTTGVLECWSTANNAGETVRGRKYDFVVIDEAALIPSGDLWQAAVRPLLTDTQGKALFASTPRGHNWFWELYQLGQDPAATEWESWRYATSDNPYIPASEIDSARRELPERVFQQEYLANFLNDGGLVFRSVEAICVGKPQPPQHDGEMVYYFGVDWGKDNDFTAISVMDVNARQVHLERFNQIGWTLQRERLMRLYEQYKPFIVLAEKNSIGAVNIDALVQEGVYVVGFDTTHVSKPQLIDLLALGMERGDVTLLDDPILKHELLTYSLQRTNYGWAYSAPPGGHDDTVIATALSLWARRKLWETRPTISFA